MRALEAFSAIEQTVLLALRDAPGTITDIMMRTELDEETIKRALRFLEYQLYVLCDETEEAKLLYPNPGIMGELTKQIAIKK